MQTKLTLRLDDRLIRRAKAHAKRSGKSVSAIVADLFARLHPAPTEAPGARSPAVRSLAAALAGHDLGRDDYRGHLSGKHR